MSFLNITISYPNFQKESLDFNLSLRERKIYLKSAVTLFILLVIIYIYLTGLIVTQTIDWENLKTRSARILSKNNQLASSLTSEQNTKSLGFYLKIGFEEPKTLNVIIRNRNVAKSANAFLY